MAETLFPLPAAQEVEVPTQPGKPRVQRPNRGQLEWRAVDVESLLAPEHPARLVWALVEQLDLSPWYGEIRAVEGGAGREAIDPAILVALWLYATLQGVGSARALARLCTEHDAYRWLCGGVSVNYHTLADFRVDNPEYLDNLLTHSVAALIADGQVSLARVSQDGKHVRASAGSSSFRRRAKLEEHLQVAKEQVRRLRQELENDPQATSKRQQAARQRAVEERQRRVEQALKRLDEIEAAKPAPRKPGKQQGPAPEPPPSTPPAAVRGMERNESGAAQKPAQKKGRRREVRASTTDAEARVMKMADGGFRPAYDVQFATDTQTQVIAGVIVSNQGNDKGQLGKMQAQLARRYGFRPKEALVDGGFVDYDDFEAVSQQGTVIYAPPANYRSHQPDPYQPQPQDTPAIAAWRERMATEPAKEIYKQRAATVECVNAIAHNRGLTAFGVRGLNKVKAVALWYALAHTLLRGRALRLAAAPA